MANHTPGPWTYDGSHIYASDGAIIAQVHNPGSRASDYPLEANRNVMAAAPELLEALEEMVRWYAKRETASMTVSGGEGLLPIEQQDEEVQQAMRAIAKATSP